MSGANQITTTRAVGVVVCAVLVVLELAGQLSNSWWLALVAGPTLLLDAVDGWVARRTGTASAAGARYDTEVDAALVAVLAVSATRFTPWALLIGAARYAFLGVGRVRPRWREVLPVRFSRKAIGVAIASLLWLVTLPTTAHPLGLACVATALALVVWTFGRDIVELERRHHALPTPSPRVASRGH
ncbi:CDP-alcohol phosphatidyltransferase family protein [Actinomycetota bacterium]